MSTGTFSLFISLYKFKRSVVLFLSTSLLYLLPIFFSTYAGAVNIEDYGALPTISLMTVSPGGNYVAFRKNNSKQDQVVVFSLKEQKVRAAFDISEITPQNMYFIDKNRIILRASKEKYMPEYRTRRLEISTAYIYDIQSNKIKQLLIPGHIIYKGQTGLGSIVALDKDKEHAFMPAYVSNLRQSQTPLYSLMKVNLNSPWAPKIHKKGNRYTEDYFLDSNGKLLAREDYNNKKNKHSVFVPQGRNSREIFQQKTQIMDLAFKGLTPDRQSLVLLNESVDTGTQSYYTMNLSDGKISPTDFGREDADIETTLKDINRVVHGVRYSGFFPSYKFFDPVLDARMQKIMANFPDHGVYLSDWSEDWKHLLVKVSGSQFSGDYFLFSEGEPGKFIAPAYPNIRKEDIHPIATINYPARDGLKIPTLLTIPKDKVALLKDLPAVMLPHGGPAAYDKIEFDWLAQALANEGYLVIQPQFRGSAGFGTQHWIAGNGEWGEKMQDDLSDGLEFLKKKGIIDPERVCIVGSSYGGYAALAGGAFTPELYKCIASINGLSDLNAMLSNERYQYGRNHQVLSYWKKVMADGEAGKKRLQSVSPSQFPDKFQSPVLLLHGEKDKVVPIKQSKIMQKKLKKAGKDVEFKKLKGENHYLENRETRLETLKYLSAFLKEHLKKDGS